MTTTTKKSNFKPFDKDWKPPVSLLDAELSFLDDLDHSILVTVKDLNRLEAVIQNQAEFFKFLTSKLDFLDAMKVHLEKGLPFDRYKK